MSVSCFGVRCGAYLFASSNTGVLGVDIPFLAPANLPNSSVTWNYSTIPQAALNNRILTYPRGRVLGGSSSISGFPRISAKAFG